jgi:hypothetical protein
MVVKRSQTAQDHAGEQLHVRGPQMEMRVWADVPRGYHFAPHDMCSGYRRLYHPRVGTVAH